MRCLVVVAVLFCLWAPAIARAGDLQPVARPNAALVAVRLDYVNPIHGVAGTPAVLQPLRLAVVAQAVADQKYLAYLRTDDLGGFIPAPIGALAWSSGGRDVVGAASGPSQIPHLATAGGGEVNSFAAVGAPATRAPDQGTQPVPGLGTPAPITPPTNTNTAPPPNQGFGGRPAPPPPTTTTTTGGPGTTTAPAPPPTTTTGRPPPTTTTTTTTTTAPTTTTSPTSTGAGPPPPSSPPGTTSCGTAGLAIFSNRSGCRIEAFNMAPGGSASETVIVRNDSGQAFTLSLRAAGTTNQLWNDLRFGVWQDGTAAPAPLPPLTFWLGHDSDLGMLQPGESIRFELELYLPTSASNTDQGLRADIDLIWRAQA